MRTDPRTPPVRRAAPQVNDIDEQEYQQLFQEGQVPSVEHLCYISREITEPAYQMLAYYTRCGLQRWPVLARPPEDAPPRPATGAPGRPACGGLADFFRPGAGPERADSAGVSADRYLALAYDDLPKPRRESVVPGLREIFGSDNGMLPGKVIR